VCSAERYAQLGGVLDGVRGGVLGGTLTGVLGDTPEHTASTL